MLRVAVVSDVCCSANRGSCFFQKCWSMPVCDTSGPEAEDRLAHLAKLVCSVASDRDQVSLGHANSVGCFWGLAESMPQPFAVPFVSTSVYVPCNLRIPSLPTAPDQTHQVCARHDQGSLWLCAL